MGITDGFVDTKDLSETWPNQLPTFDDLFSSMLFAFSEKANRDEIFNADWANKKRTDESSFVMNPTSYVRDAHYRLPESHHSAMSNFAQSYLENLIPGKLGHLCNPIHFLSEVLSNSENQGNDLLPPSSFVNVYPGNFLSDDNGYFTWSHENNIDIKQLKAGGHRTLRLPPLDYERFLGQFYSAVCDLAYLRRNSHEPLVTDGFDGKRNYFPEGLKFGSILIDGDVGHYSGKHSEGGNIVVTGNAGMHFGHTANNTNLYIKGNVGSVGARSGSNVYVCGKISHLHDLSCNLVTGDEARKAYDAFVNGP